MAGKANTEVIYIWASVGHLRYASAVHGWLLTASFSGCGTLDCHITRLRLTLQR